MSMGWGVHVQVGAQELLNVTIQMPAGAASVSTPVSPPPAIITALLPPAPPRRAFNQLHLGGTTANEAL